MLLKLCRAEVLYEVLYASFLAVVVVIVVVCVVAEIKQTVLWAGILFVFPSRLFRPNSVPVQLDTCLIRSLIKPTSLHQHPSSADVFMPQINRFV